MLSLLEVEEEKVKFDKLFSVSYMVEQFQQMF